MANRVGNHFLPFYDVWLKPQIMGCHYVIMGLIRLWILLISDLNY